MAAKLEAIRALPARDEPLGWWLGDVAVSLRKHGHRDAAHKVLDEAIAWWYQTRHDTKHLRADLAWALYQAARWNDAQRLYEELAEEYPEDTGYLAALGQLAARRGDREEALRISEGLRSVEYPLREWRATRMRASIAAVLGDREEAMTLLQQVIDRIVPGSYWVGLHRDIDFESLRDYPPFREFLRPKG